jgi:CMP-N-acetylneuraminic acid synthetase
MRRSYCQPAAPPVCDLSLICIGTDDCPKKYFDAGMFAVFPTARMKTSQGAGSDERFTGYVIPKEKGIDIDDEGDWALAESIYRMRSASR